MSMDRYTRYGSGPRVPEELPLGKLFVGIGIILILIFIYLDTDNWQDFGHTAPKKHQGRIK
jgi:hypothetical protein